MTRDEAIAQMKVILGFKTNLDDTLIAAMKWQQTELELSPTKPWFLLSEYSDYTTEAGEQRVALPTDFLLEYEEGCLSYRPATYPTEKEVDLEKGFLEELKRNYKDADAATPEAYALSGNYFLLFPTPADAYNLRMKYYKRAAVLNSNIENEWLMFAPGVLIGQAGAIVAAGLRDWKAKEQFDRIQQKATLLLENQNEARKHENLECQMGGRHI